MTSHALSDTGALPWQHVQWQRIRQQIDADRLPHALLLAGPRWVGKRVFGRALGASLLCLSPRYGTACGECKSCRLLAAQAHPDWHWVAPEEEGKAVKIDQVRDLVESMAQTAQQGGRKVAVIEPAEAMNRNAANALLKTLEEPAGSSLLILISDAPGLLLPTLRSRCQRLDFPIPPAAAVRSWLQIQAAADKADLAMAEAEGRPLLARELLIGEEAASRRELDAEFAAVLERQLPVLAAAERWKQRDWRALLQWLESRLARALRSQVSPEIEAGAVVARLAIVPPATLFALSDQLRALAQQTFAGANPNPQLALEAFLFNVCDALNKKNP